MIVPTRLWSHDCAHTRLCPHTFVHTRIFSQTHLCPDMIVPTHVCAQAWLCPDTLVPQHELWPDMIMSLENNYIINVSTRLCVNFIGENTSMLNCCWRSEVKCDYFTKYCLIITSSYPTGIFRNFIITCQGTKYVSGHKRIWAQTYTYVCAQTHFVSSHDCDH